MEKHPLHLKNPELQTSPEVERAVEREERHTGEDVPNTPSERIEAYTDRLENIFLNPDERVRQRNLEVLKDKIYDTLIIKRENFPDSYFELQKRIARERGQPVEEIPPDVREQMIDTAIEDQKASLDAWTEYLTSSDAIYPAWFKYYAWSQVIKLSQFDKERGEFKKRTATTVAPFPDIYREPLAQIADLYERVKDNNKDSEARREFDKKFPSLYAELITKSLSASMESREKIQGNWIKYQQGDSTAAKNLFESLEGKGTGWCTAGRSTAEAQIKSGDFYVYYTNDASGNPTQPRLAVRMEGKDKIGEVRGVLPYQGVEPLMQEVLDEKLREFGSEAERFKKKSADMKQLTLIEKKTAEKENLTRDELRFLYEMDGKIQGFGYNEDPRIDEILGQRNKVDDMRALHLGSIPEIERSDAANDSDLVLWLAKEEGRNNEIISQIMPSLGDLTEKCALELMDNHRVRLVASHLEKFKGTGDSLDNTIAFKLIENDQAKTVAKYLEKFRNPSEVIEILIEKGFALHLIENLERYQEINNEELISTLIDAGQGEKIAEKIEKRKDVKGLTEAIFIKLFETGVLDKIKDWREFFSRFSDLGEASASMLIGAGRTGTVENFLGHFHNLSKEILFKLLGVRRVVRGEVDTRDSEYGRYVAKNLDSFKDLDNEVAQFLTGTEVKESNGSIFNRQEYYRSLAYAVADNLEKFHGVDHMQLLSTLLAKNDTEAIIRNIEKFPEIDQQQFVDGLFREGDLRTEMVNFSDNLPKFQRIDRDKLAGQIMGTRDNETRVISDNLEYFLPIGPLRLAELLMKKESGMWVVCNEQEKFKGLSNQDRQALALQLVREGSTSVLRGLIRNIRKFVGIDYDAVFGQMLEVLAHSDHHYNFLRDLPDELKDGRDKLENLNLSPEIRRRMEEMGVLKAKK